MLSCQPVMHGSVLTGESRQIACEAMGKASGLLLVCLEEKNVVLPQLPQMTWICRFIREMTLVLRV